MAVIHIGYSRYMDETSLASAMSALAHPLRLKAMRELSRSPQGIAAGDLAQRLMVRQNTLSPHVAALERNGIVFGHRHGRHIIYKLDPIMVDAVLNKVRALSAMD